MNKPIKLYQVNAIIILRTFRSYFFASSPPLLCPYKFNYSWLPLCSKSCFNNIYRETWVTFVLNLWEQNLYFFLIKNFIQIFVVSVREGSVFSFTAIIAFSPIFMTPILIFLFLVPACIGALLDTCHILLDLALLIHHGLFCFLWLQLRSPLYSPIV